MHLRRRAEKRVYRLATLLTGDPIAATRVLDAVLASQPDPTRLDRAHLDRLTILRCREVEPAQLVADQVPVEAARAVWRLPAQQREAWVLVRADRRPLREAARAMDCSVTATRRHLERAEAGLAESLGSGAAAATAALVEHVASIEVPAFHRAARRARAQRRRVIALVAIVAVILATMWVASRLAG